MNDEGKKDNTNDPDDENRQLPAGEQIEVILSRALSEALSVAETESGEPPTIGVTGRAILLGEVHTVTGEPFLFTVYSRTTNWDAIGMFETEIERLKEDLRRQWRLRDE